MPWRTSGAGLLLKGSYSLRAIPPQKSIRCLSYYLKYLKNLTEALPRAVQYQIMEKQEIFSFNKCYGVASEKVHHSTHMAVTLSHETKE